MKPWALWNDPASDRKRVRSTGTAIRRDADRWAAKLEAELAAGVAQGGRRTTWKEFRGRVERDFLPEKRPSTRDRYVAAMNAVERHMNPALMTGIDADALDGFKAGLRAKGVRETTVANDLRHVMAVLRRGHRRKVVAGSSSTRIRPGRTGRGRNSTR